MSQGDCVDGNGEKSEQVGRASRPSWALGLVAFVLASTACREERVAIVPTMVRDAADAASAKLKDVALGDIVRTRRNDRDPVGVLRADNGYVNEQDVAKLPLVVEKRFVTDFNVALWRDPMRTQRVRALDVAEQIMVLAADPLPDVDVVAHDGKPVGFVSRAAIMTTKPTRPSLWERVQARLREQDLHGTRRALEAMLVVEPDDEVAREMLSVLLAGVDWKRSRALAAGLVPPMPYLDGGLTRADTTGLAYVLASVLRVRSQPTETSTMIRQLPIGTAVVIEELRGDGWARIHVRDDRAQSVVADGTGLGGVIEVPTDIGPGYDGGYALARYLTPTAPTLEVIEARRKDAEGRGMMDEATLWAQRANELAPSHERRASLIEAALQAMRWTVAAGALLPTGVERPGVRTDVDLTFVYGCRGDPRRAVLVPPTAESVGEVGNLPALRDVKSEAACTTLNVTRPCPLCWLSDEELTPEQKVADDAAAKVERTRIDAAVAAHEKLMLDAEAAFPDGPFLRVRSHPATWPKMGDSESGVSLKPWLAIVRFDASQVAQEDDVLLSVTSIPVPNGVDDGVLDVWMPVPAEESLRFDVLFAESEADAKSKLMRAPAPADGDVAPGVSNASVVASWSRAADGCDCGC